MKIIFLIFTLTTIFTHNARAQSGRVYKCVETAGPTRGIATLIVSPLSKDNYFVKIKVTHQALRKALVGRAVVEYHSHPSHTYSGKGQLGQYTNLFFGIDTYSGSTNVRFVIRGGIPGVIFRGYGQGGEFRCEPALAP